MVGAYVALTKPRIIELLLVTTVPAMVLAERGMPPIWLILVTVLGGTLTAGGANGIQIEQSPRARASHWGDIADAVANVYKPKLGLFSH